MNKGYLTIGAIALAILAGRKSAQGVGKLKRRVYAEAAQLQNEGYDLSLAWNELGRSEQSGVERVAHAHESAGDWKPSSRSSKTAGEQYWNSVRRAYNAISGIGATDIRPREYEVKNAAGDVIMIYRDYGTDEQKFHDAYMEVSPDRINDYSDAYLATVCYIANGGKFIWSDKKLGGVLESVFAGGGKHDAERKARISYLASKAKGGQTPTAVAHQLWQMGGGARIDDLEIRNAVDEVLLSFESVGQARKYVYDTYIQRHTVDDRYDAGNEDLPF